MCGSHGTGGGCCCCPPAQIRVEKICGTFQAPLLFSVTSLTVWRAPAVDNDYFEGTFQITLQQGNGVTGNITTSGVDVPFPLTLSGESIAGAVRNPTSFTINGIDDSDIGKWCITLYKRVLV
ncbi:S-Ena type endospore appendage [Neobacillus niacini]|uniref:S-Ena type endospore appendage n=1 Tax=Neobacillus niacini TaxID=86668 RepID=UPI0005EE1669|nr:S-Ena type endospore appendage [Neobacillus niacini]